MAISYFETAWNTAPDGGAPGARYKDLTFTGCQVGDLLVVFGFCANYTASAGTRSVATQTGTTSAWTQGSPAVVLDADVDAVGGFATVSVAGDITVRVTLRQTDTQRQGVAGFLIPAAEVGPTYGWATTFVGDTDGQASVTLTATSVTLYGASDWNALDPGSTTTPGGGTVRTTYFDGDTYAVFVASWLSQASGTRSYGPSGLTGRDFSGLVFRMDQPVAAITGTATNTAPAMTQAASGTVTAPSVTGTAGSVVPAAIQQADGTASEPTPPGGWLESEWGTADATLTDPATSSISSTIPPMSQAAIGTVSNPGGGGSFVESAWGTADATLFDPVPPAGWGPSEWGAADATLTDPVTVGEADVIYDFGLGEWVEKTLAIYDFDSGEWVPVD